MYNYKLSGIFSALGFWLLLQIFILPIGCSTVPGPGRKDAGSPPLPVYESGTTYVYSNGAWETVADVSPPLITWHDHRGNVYNRSPDFTYRSLRWTTGSGQGSRQIVPRSDLLVHKDSSLWPLQKGNQAAFTEMVSSHKFGEPVKTHRVNWTCEVTGKERIEVMAGKFDTWKITCHRYTNSKNPSKAAVKETRTWNYAPEVNHYVLAERLYSGGKADRRLELLAIMPPLNGFSDLARGRMRNAFQMALENKRSGETAVWSTPNASGSGRITPLETFKLTDGRYSRRYIQKIMYPDGQKIYYGLAVRDPAGRWIIPRR